MSEKNFPLSETGSPESIPYAVDRRTLREDAPIIALLALDLLFGFFIWGRMPARVPIHFDGSGTPNGWGPAWINALMFPLVATVTYVLTLYLPLIDPRKRNYSLFADTVRFIRGVMVLFLVGSHIPLILASFGHPLNMRLAAQIPLPLLFIAFGNRFGRIRPNWFFGIRVPWTLANEEVWNRTHRMAGRLWVVGGILLLPAAFLPPSAGMAVLMAGTAVLAIVPIVYSAVIFKRLGGSAPEHGDV